MDDPELNRLAAELLDLERQRHGAPLPESGSARRQALISALMDRLNQHPGDERRRFLRIPAQIEVRFRVGGASITCAATEMGLGGLALAGHLWVIDQPIVLEELSLGGKRFPLECTCRVAWKLDDEDGQPKAGLQFVEPSSDARKQLRAIFEELFLQYLATLAQDGP